MSLTLYYHPLSSYCHKVLIALYEGDIAFEKRLINLGESAGRAELQALWPLGKFPVIRDHAQACTVAESTSIIEHLDHFHPTSPPLIPTAWSDAHEVRLWDRIFDNHVQGPMNRFVMDRISGANADLARDCAALITAYEMISEHVKSREWISSTGFTMADCSAAPALFYAATIVPVPASHGHLLDYMARLMERPSVARTLIEAKPYFDMYPFVEAIPPQFR